ncbi:MAG TPA: DUF5615 family PIN-like protein [Chloroflexota bacterium]|jgi:predicted nuclease of predicted toxin-antitoxin system|nr:DUF5615 family PIN-like protein [Chloroflexota bacterium]
MSLRFLLDEVTSTRVAVGLRERGVDAVSVHELGHGGLADEDQLLFAAERGRVLMTYDRADYQARDAQWREEAREHAGVLWCTEKSLPRRDIGGLLHAAESVAQQFTTLAGLCLPMPRPNAKRTRPHGGGDLTDRSSVPPTPLQPC